VNFDRKNEGQPSSRSSKDWLNWRLHLVVPQNYKKGNNLDIWIKDERRGFHAFLVKIDGEDSADYDYYGRVKALNEVDFCWG
jgi:hypothetical protein